MKLLSTLFLTLTFSLFAVDKISVQEGAALQKAGKAMIVDVREAGELKEEGKAAPALWLPKSSVEAKDSVYDQAIAGFSKDLLVILYCRSGKRAEWVATELEKIGFKTRNMGGFSDWKAAGLPITK